MSTDKPTVLFIHGSWHSPAHFAPVREVFATAGFPTVCPVLPSLGSLPPIGLAEDAACIEQELQRLVGGSKQNVVVVAHSYGGVVATQAVKADFAVRRRQSVGETGGVVGLVYLAAFVLPLGASLESALGGALPPFIPVDKDGLCTMLEPEHRFYNDLTPAEQVKWVAELKPCPAITQQTALTYEAFLHHPVTYLYCENDQALPLHVQQMMVAGIANTTDATIHEKRCLAGHSPFLSMPEKVLEVVQDMLGMA